MNSQLTLSAEERRAAEYEAFSGPSADYYATRFVGFDSGASMVGWHWPALFMTSLWFLYRKMWGQALIYLLAVPFVTLILSFIVGAFFGMTAGLWFVGVVTTLVWIAAPLFANFLYWRHARSEIDSVAARLVGDARLQEIERRGGTTWWGPVIAFGSSFFFAGILAAIAIPAYQDYTIRSQIFGGLNLASEVKSLVAEQYAGSREWPTISAAALELPPTRYVDSIYVEDGSVVIRYGNGANDLIDGQSLAITAGVNDAGEVVWSCGNAALADGVQAAPGPTGTEIADKYLPASCRAP